MKNLVYNSAIFLNLAYIYFSFLAIIFLDKNWNHVAILISFLYVFFFLPVPTCDGKSILYIQINSFILAYIHSSILAISFLDTKLKLVLYY